jgi:hypothetical protein
MRVKEWLAVIVGILFVIVPHCFFVIYEVEK